MDTEAKRKPFTIAFVSLGVKVHFVRSQERVIVLRNRRGRLESICATAIMLLKPEAILGFKKCLP